MRLALVFSLMLLMLPAGNASASPLNPSSITWPKLPLACLPERAEKWQDQNTSPTPCHCPPQSFCPQPINMSRSNVDLNVMLVGISGLDVQNIQINGAEVAGLQDNVGQILAMLTDPAFMQKVAPAIDKKLGTGTLVKDFVNSGGNLVINGTLNPSDADLSSWLDSLKMPIEMVKQCCNDPICPHGYILSNNVMKIQTSVCHCENAEGKEVACTVDTDHPAKQVCHLKEKVINVDRCILPPPPPPPSQETSSACTASAAICDLYDRNLGRLPDQSGSEYWQDRYNILALSGLSNSTISQQLDHEMSGNAEVQFYFSEGGGFIPDQRNVGYLSSGTAHSSDCWGSTACGGASDSTAASAQHTINGWNSVENIIGSSYVANGIAGNLNQAGIDYWSGQYQGAIDRGRTPEEAAQDVQNAINTAIDH